MTDKIREMMEDIKEMSRSYNIKVIVPSSYPSRSINQSSEIIMLGIKEDESSNTSRTNILKKRKNPSDIKFPLDYL